MSSDNKRNLLQEAMLLQTDEERKAFVESLSLEERQELYLQITRVVNAAWDIFSVVFSVSYLIASGSLYKP